MITIRYAEHKDADILARYAVSMAFETEKKHLNKDIVFKGIRQVLAFKELGFYLIAEIDGQPAGALMVTYEWSDWRNGLFYWIQSVYTDPIHRKKGIYRALHKKVRTIAQSKENVIGIRLYVEKENTGAISTYRSMGMEECDYRMFEEEF